MKPQAAAIEVERAESDSEPSCSPVLRRNVVSMGDAEGWVLDEAAR